MADEPRTVSRGASLSALIWALIFGIVAAVGFTGRFEWLFHSGTKWVFAAAIAFVGLVLLLTALPRRGRD